MEVTQPFLFLLIKTIWKMFWHNTLKQLQNRQQYMIKALSHLQLIGRLKSQWKWYLHAWGINKCMNTEIFWYIMPCELVNYKVS